MGADGNAQLIGKWGEESAVVVNDAWREECSWPRNGGGDANDLRVFHDGANHRMCGFESPKGELVAENIPIDAFGFIDINVTVVRACHEVPGDVAGSGGSKVACRVGLEVQRDKSPALT